MKTAVMLLGLSACAGACTSAFAQSSVTMFGIVDLGFAYVKGSHGGTAAMTNSGASFSRWGLRGTEDLGNGLKAGFWLEAPLSADVGQGANPMAGLSFIRRATVSLSGNFGELRMGQDFSASYQNPAWFDPFQGTGIGAPNSFLMLGAPIRVSNAVSYFLPSTLGGLYGQAQYAFGEEPSTSPNSKKGNYLGLRLGWANKQLNLAASLASQRTGSSALADKLTIASVAGSYDFGVVKPMAYWAMEKTDSGARIDAFLLGLTAPVGSAGELRAALSHYNRKSSSDDWNKLSLGYLHKLSPRTAVYGTVAHVSNRGAAKQIITTTGLGNAPISQSISVDPGGRSSGIEFGLRHSF